MAWLVVKHKENFIFTFIKLSGDRNPESPFWSTESEIVQRLQGGEFH
jgi:hypothetical protein